MTFPHKKVSAFLQDFVRNANCSTFSLSFLPAGPRPSSPYICIHAHHTQTRGGSYSTTTNLLLLPLRHHYYKYNNNFAKLYNNGFISFAACGHMEVAVGRQQRDKKLCPCKYDLSCACVSFLLLVVSLVLPVCLPPTSVHPRNSS